MTASSKEGGGAGEGRVAAFGAAVAATLRRYAAEGVPYRNQGVDPAFGLDCVGALIAAARENGLALEVHNDWPRTARGRLEAALKAWCRRVGRAALQPGDLVVMGRGEMTHAGLLTGLDAAGAWQFLHANDKGVHRSTLVLQRPSWEGSAVHPLRGFYRLRPEMLEAGR